LVEVAKEEDSSLDVVSELEESIETVERYLENKEEEKLKSATPKFVLKEGQEQAVQTVVRAANKVVTDGPQIVTILGKAGTGKTTIVGEYLHRIQQNYGRQITVICSATSHEATNLLYKKIKSMVGNNPYILVKKSTVASLLGKKPDGKGGFKVNGASWKEKQQVIANTDVIIWDECSMLPTSDCE
jgi:Cdc6-like AAA superfamily ATPase